MNLKELKITGFTYDGDTIGPDGTAWYIFDDNEDNFIGLTALSENEVLVEIYEVCERQEIKKVNIEDVEKLCNDYANK